MRLALILSNYEVEIKHVKGGDSWICDSVSRYFEKIETDFDVQNSLTISQANELFKIVKEYGPKIPPQSSPMVGLEPP